MEFQQFYNLSIKFVYRYFYSRISDKALVEDLCQEVYFDFYKKYGHLNLSETEAVKILFGFCRVTFKKHQRLKFKNREVDFNDEMNYFENEGDIRKSEISKEFFIPSLLSRLSPKLREVLLLRFFQNLTRKDTAKVMGIKSENVHTYQKRALKQLRDIVKEGE